MYKNIINNIKIKNKLMKELSIQEILNLGVCETKDNKIIREEKIYI
jgi:hypothetical protein